MTLAVAGLGLISPAGSCARDHAFFPRAEGPPPAPSPFLGEDGRRLDAAHCPWLSADFSASSRMIELARAALDEATAPLAQRALGAPLFLVTPEPRPGLSAEQIAALGRALGGLVRAPSVSLFPGAAGAFAALAQIRAALDARQLTHALLVGVDSLVTLEMQSARVRNPPSPFLLAPSLPAEGAAALLLTAPSEAARLGLRSLGEIVHGHHERGRGSDEDDEPVDGAAMTTLLRGLPVTAPITSVFGQSETDLLRLRDWHFASARCAERLASLRFAPCLEAATGELGAAAGVANLAFAFATFRHDLAPSDATGPFVAWAISRDGARGLALGSPARPDEAALLPLRGAARARKVELVPLPPREAEPALDADELAPHDTEPPDLVANDIVPLLPALPEQITQSPPVTLDPDRRAPIPLADFHASVVQHAAELASALARARFDGPRRELARTEARLLRQLDAIVAAGPLALAEVARFGELRARDPFAASAAALATAAFAGDEPMALLARAIHALPPEAEDHVITLAEALALSDHPGLTSLARELAASPHAPARALGTSLCAARGDLSFESVYAAMADPSPQVARAGIWATDRLPSAQRGLFLKLLRERCQSALPGVAWSAARVLALWGDREVSVDRLDGSLGVHLGARAAELFVLAGAPTDWPKLEALLGQHRTTRALISTVARFGSPASASWLILRLDDDALGEAVERALLLLFGPIVAPEASRLAPAWRRALGERSFDPALRLVRGRPWSPAAVADECTSGALSRLELALRIDELRARCHLPDPVDLGAWAAEADARLSTFLRTLRR
jgi:hypothetical protein